MSGEASHTEDKEVSGVEVFMERKFTFPPGTKITFHDQREAIYAMHFHALFGPVTLDGATVTIGSNRRHSLASLAKELGFSDADLIGKTTDELLSFLTTSWGAFVREDNG